MREQWHYQHHRRDQAQNDDAHDQQGGECAVNAEPFKPIGDRGENVSKYDTADERQQDFVQQP